MNLHHVNPPDERGQRVTCLGCLARVPLATCMADLEGPAFIAYYCPECVADMAHVNALSVDAGHTSVYHP